MRVCLLVTVTERMQRKMFVCMRCNGAKSAAGGHADCATVNTSKKMKTQDAHL